MRISLNIYRIHKEDGIRKYIELSQNILKKTYEIRQLYPDIYSKCPICSKIGCAIWKGYYFRLFVCTSVEFEANIAIRKGFCKSTKQYFSCPLDIIIPYCKYSILILIKIIADYCKHNTTNKVLDSIDIALSSLYRLMQFIVSTLIINIHEFNLPNISTNSISEILKIKNFNYKNILLQQDYKWNAVSILSGIDPP